MNLQCMALVVRLLRQRGNRSSQLLLLFAVYTLSAATAHSAVMRVGPLPYLSAADSPFVANSALTTVLEDFEDGALNAPGVSEFLPFNGCRGILLGPGANGHSVDGDDGVIDGSGSAGHSYQSTTFSGVITLPTRFAATFVFDFQPLPNGQYPTALGFVWTHGEPGSHVLMLVSESNTTFGGQTIGFSQTFGEAAAGDSTADDRFIGATSDIGIRRVVIESVYYGRSETDDGAGRLQFFELDHLQFTYPRVPEPSSPGLWACAAAACLLHQRRRPTR